jgi:putative ABC transport system permease protein
MNDFDLVRKNLFRRKLRAVLMIVSILIAFMIFGVLAGFYRAFTAGEDAAAADRMITVNKINFTQPMPIAYFNRVKAVEGVRQVTFANWFGGYYQDPKNFIMALAVEPNTYFDVYRSEFEVPPEQLQAFMRDRGSAVIGESLAQKWGWKIGDRIPVASNIFSQKSGGHTWDLTIAGIVKGKADHVDTNFLLFQYAYFDETRSFGKDTIGWMILQTASPENNDRVAKTIDAMFANSTAETSTDTEKAFGKAFAAQFGNIALIVLLVVGAAFVTILMIVGNTMALSIRERTREIGVLKTLGFSGPRILGMVLGESVLLALLGGIPGLAHAAQNCNRARTGIDMRSLWLQVAAVTSINLKSITQRRWLSLSTVIAIALVVIVLLAFLAMANGFQRTIAGSGADDIAIVLRAGSQAEINSTVSRDQVRLIEDGPGIARGGDGKPLISPELYLVVDGIKRSTKTKANLPLRGIGEQGTALRKGVTITAGRMFNRGSNEVVVGKALLREFEGLDLGSTVSFGATRWNVVGVFEAGGSVFESEIWADLNVVQSLFNRNNIVQTVRARLTGPAALNELKSYSDNDPRLKLDVKSEAAYFAEQASQTSDLIQKLGWPLAIAMALGAVAGALNTMYSSVAARATEIATLRAIGFGGFPAFVGTLAESLLLAVIGGLLGAAATYLIFDGVTASTLGGNFTQVVFDFKLSPWLIAEGVALALIVGLIGGLFPALRAARMPIVAGLHPN